jgi:hypothetical protein
MAAVAVAVAVAAPPPINRVIIRERVSKRWIAGLVVGLAAVMAPLCMTYLNSAGGGQKCPRPAAKKLKVGPEAPMTISLRE